MHILVYTFPTQVSVLFLEVVFWWIQQIVANINRYTKVFPLLYKEKAVNNSGHGFRCHGDPNVEIKCYVLLPNSINPNLGFICSSPLSASGQSIVFQTWCYSLFTN